jgi:DNA gyrase subunit A
MHACNTSPAGKASGKLRDQDVLDELLSCRAHDTLLLLSAAGRGYGIKAHKVPEASRAAMGTPIAQVRLCICCACCV